MLTQSDQNLFKKLPQEVFLFLLSFLPVADLLWLGFVSKMIKHNVDDDRIWKQKILIYFKNEKILTTDSSNLKSQFFKEVRARESQVNSYVHFFQKDEYNPEALLKNPSLIRFFGSNTKVFESWAELDQWIKKLTDDRPYKYVNCVFGFNCLADKLRILLSTPTSYEKIGPFLVDISQCENGKQINKKFITYDAQTNKLIVVETENQKLREVFKRY